MHVEPEMPADATGADRPAGDAAASRPRRPRRRREVRARRHAQRARARQRARDGRARRRRRHRASAAAQRRRRDRQPRRLDRLARRSPIRSRSPSTRSRAIAADAPLHCADAAVEQQMIAEIDRAREAGDTMGGSFEVIAHGVPPGLGSYVQWDRKLDGRLAQALMSIPAIKAVGIGRGPAVADAARLARPRRDPAGRRRRPATPIGVARPTNNAGGLEGGVTNGEDLRVTGYMKPIATLMKPLRSVDLTTMDGEPRGDRAQRRLRRPGRGRRRRSDGRRSCSPTRCSRSSAATRSRSSSGNWQAFAAERTSDRFRAPDDWMIRPILKYGDASLHARAAASTPSRPTSSGSSTT